MPTRPKAFTVLGIVFLLLGVFSFLTVAQGWYLGGTILARAGVYGLMDLLIAYAFFARQWWLWPAFTLNAVGQIVLLATRYSQTFSANGAFLFACFGTALALALAWYAFSKRAILTHDRPSYVLFALFVCAWGAGFWYALTTIIPALQ